jgi:Flp pilus assembly protein TadB
MTAILVPALAIAAVVFVAVRYRRPHRRLRHLIGRRAAARSTAAGSALLDAASASQWPKLAPTDRVTERLPRPGIDRWTAAVGRLFAAAGRRRSEAERLRELPFAAELFAAVLKAGLPPDTAALACGAAVGGELGGLFTRAGRALRLGAEPVQAWQYLAELPAARSLVRVLVRSADNGTSCAAAAIQLAQELRAAAAQAELASARRAGVLVVLPLGLCFLPAFVLAGVVPVVAAVLRGALR